MTARRLPLTFLISLIVLPLASCSSCKKGAPDSDAGPDTGVGMAPTASVSATTPPVASEQPAPSAEPTTSAKPTTAAGGPWQGTYGCLSHLTLAQNGNTVSGSKTFGTDTDTWRCTISGDTCTGTETRTHHYKGKPAEVGKTRALTFKRDANGTIHYNAEGNAPQNCPKS